MTYRQPAHRFVQFFFKFKWEKMFSITAIKPLEYTCLMTTFKIDVFSKNDQQADLTKVFFNERVASIKTRFSIFIEDP